MDFLLIAGTGLYGWHRAPDRTLLLGASLCIRYLPMGYCLGAFACCMQASNHGWLGAFPKTAVLWQRTLVLSTYYVLPEYSLPHARKRQVQKPGSEYG